MNYGHKNSAERTTAHPLIAGMAPGDELWCEKKTATYLGLSPKTLRSWRHLGTVDFPFCRLNGRTIRYRRSDVEAFVARSRCRSTSDAGNAR